MLEICPPQFRAPSLRRSRAAGRQRENLLRCLLLRLVRLLLPSSIRGFFISFDYLIFSKKQAWQKYRPAVIDRRYLTLGLLIHRFQCWISK